MPILWILLTIGIIGACFLSFIKRFTAKKTCCGTEKQPRIKPKKLTAPIGKLTLKIGGMHCENCRRSVVAALNALDGVAAKIDPENQTADVFYERTVDDTELIKAVAAAGFEVLNIQR